MDRLAATLNRMLDRIGFLMDTLRHVSTDIAHDLRTPLGHLRHALDDARERARDVGEYREAIGRAIAEVDSILETFSALLRIAQIESGSRRAGFQRADLSEMATRVVQSFAPAAEEQGRILTADIESDVDIYGDRELLTQLSANLLDNAVRHTPAGSAIHLSLTAREGGAVLEVSDNGNGVPREEREKIFNRFYRGEARAGRRRETDWDSRWWPRWPGFTARKYHFSTTIPAWLCASNFRGEKMAGSTKLSARAVPPQRSC